MRLLKLSAVLATAALAIACNSTTPTAKSSTAPTSSTSTAPTSTASTATVTVSDFKFDPATITIKAGDSVTWSFQGPTPHSSTADDSSTEKWDSTVMGAGKTYSHQFNTKGTFTYHCVPHANMQATVIVQ